MNLSIIVPCYNEEKNIRLILEKFKKVITNEKIEVILVNNGSTDNSERILENLLPKYFFAKTVFVPVNQGYGYGILQGLKEAKGKFIGWTHADMQTDPKDVIKAYKILEENNWDKNLYIKGNRKKRPFLDQIFTFGMSLFETIFMRKVLYDINAQPNIFSKEFFLIWENPPKDFSFDLYALYMAKKKNLKVIRFDVLFPERIHGKSTWNTGLGAKWKFIKRTLTFSIELKRRGIK
ncbi:glycosyltransferase family 2 protein [Leptotrichia sp. OH3620_COT-345]|uniref:glycosyltransferase family 2 protein n=1 Tax=Leptotrichia sp. OH3620_COT-345 TaxID=2491048 RepID=UPI000F64D933|nr:glycosyltransferase family 2 protein [Leptotrichia sp. OH3620_COT-345]RRD40761.1 glycosyltransferase family 2 protein [Leptotrichia sp. OH3620_COT-345]